MESINSLIVVSFKNSNGEVIKTFGIDRRSNFNYSMIPKSATSYYLYSKDNEKYSKKASCQIGKPLSEVINQSSKSARTFEELDKLGIKYAYVLSNNEERVVRISSDMKLAKDFEDFSHLFESDFESVKNINKIYTKKM